MSVESPLRNMEDRLRRGFVIPGDTAVGTELIRKGIRPGKDIWSAESLRHKQGRRALIEIHRANRRGGAKILTDNSFATLRIDSDSESRRATLTAGRIALAVSREAGNEDIVVAGSMGPVGKPYSLQAPAKRKLSERHRRHADNLAEAGVHLILAQPISNSAEAESALGAGREVGLPVAIEVYCATDRQGHITNLDFVRDTLVMARDLKAIFFGVGCVNPRTATQAVESFDVRGAGLPISVCAEGFDLDSPDRIPGISEEDYPTEFFKQIGICVAGGVQVVSGCCGTSADRYLPGLVEFAESFNSSVEQLNWEVV